MFPRDQFTAVNDPSANTSPQFAFEQSPVNHLSSPAVPNAPHPVTSNQPFAMNHPPQNTGPMPQGHLTPTFVTAQLPPQEAPWWPQTGQMTLGEHALFDNPQAMDTGMSLFGFFGDGANNGCNFRPVMPFHPAPPRPQQIHQPSPVAAPVPAPAASLPSGGCNAGPPESRCGCRRFYSSNSTDKPDGHQFCMCSHHACFHDHDSTPSSTHPPTPVTTHLETPVSYVPMGPPPPPQPQPKTVPVSHPTKTPLQDISDRFIHPASSFGNENARPRSIHSVHSVHSGRSQPPSPARSEPAELRVTGHPPPRQEVPATIQQQHPTSIVNLQHHDSQKTNTAPDDVSIPDTQSCSGSVMNADASREDSMSTVIAPATGRARALLMSTPRPGSQRSVSTTSSRFMLPFGGKCLQLSRPTKRREPLQDRTDDMPEIKKERRSDVPPSRCDSRATTCSASELSTPQPPPAQMTVSGMYNMVNSHQARIDRLENASIVTNAHEECLDRHENVDTRVCELENRMDDVEKQLADGSFKRSEPGSADGSFDKQEFLQQFHSLQEQIAELQQTSPSVAHPWNIEVVLLPFPLRKLWMRNPEFPLDGSITASDNDDWTCNWTNRGAPTTPFLEDRSVDSREQEWLLPRVYRADSVVYERLQSRGFVRTVTVTGGDARSVQIAINHSFKDLLQQLAANRPPRPEVKASKFMGLQQDWIPLRRIPHDTRLRFLSRNEMVTPALFCPSCTSMPVLRTVPETQRDTWPGGRERMVWIKGRNRVLGIIVV